MYLKLINSNVKKTLQDYQIYIITLVVSSALFFSFISLSSPCNTIIADGTKYSDAMFRQTINLTVGLVSLIFFVLVNYVNNHMIKRRAKEFSIYMLLGMEQKKIAFLYFVETLEVGLLAILIGTIAGTLLSGALTSIVILATGGDFDYKLGFYPDTFFKTMLFFIFVFILVGVFNTTKLSKTKLINLLNADKTVEGHLQNKKKYFISLIVTIISFASAVIMIKDYLSTGRGYMSNIPSVVSNKYQLIIGILLVCGIFSGYYAVSYIIYVVKERSKHYKYKKLNGVFISNLYARSASNAKVIASATIAIAVSILGFVVAPVLADISEEFLKFRMPYKIFQDKIGNQYLYLIDNNAIFLLDEKSKKMLSLEGLKFNDAYVELSDIMTKEEFQTLFDNMVRAGLIVSDKGPVLKEEKKEEITLNGLTLMIIQECNLRCTYCYGEGGEYQDRGKMSLETAKKSIDFLIGNSKNKELLICFLGGEPLMNFPLIKDVVAYCNKYENDKPIHFKYTITTNGTIWNDEIEKFLREKHFTVQISVDGNKDVHNCNRFYANGLGSFDVMEKNTRNMRNDGLVSGRATITATNLDLVDNFKALNDMKFRSIPMAPAQNLLSDEDYDRLIGENTKLVQYFLELIQSGDYKTAKKLRILMSGLQKIHKSGVARKILCGVGSAQLAVDINGEIYPCHRFVANKEYAMGNVLKDTKIEKMPFLEEITLEKHKECKNCWARNLCVGACPNENLVNAGTTQKSDSKNCRFIQAMYNDLIHAYLELTVENKKQLLG